MEFRHTFRKKLEDPNFRDAIYDYIVELEAEVASLKEELYHLTGKAVFEIMKEDRDVLKELADSQENDYIMTEEEAEALLDTSNRNLPKIPVRQLREKALDELVEQAEELDMGY